MQTLALNERHLTVRDSENPAMKIIAYEANKTPESLLRGLSATLPFGLCQGRTFFGPDLIQE